MKGQQKRFSVLIVENDPAELFLFESACSQFKEFIDVDFLMSGQQLLDFFAKDKIQRDLNRQVIPDLVLVNMKAVSSDMACVQKIRNHSQFRDLPICLFSEEERVEIPTRFAGPMGATEIMRRPYTFYALTQVISEILEKYHLCSDTEPHTLHDLPAIAA